MKRLWTAAVVLPLLMVAPARAAEKRAADKPAADDSAVELNSRFSHWGLAIKGQNWRDTCAVFTFVGALEYALSARQGRGVRLSEEYANWAANEVGAQYVDGATFAELIQGFNTWGTCDQRLLPYQMRFNPAVQPSARAIENARGVWEESFRWHWLARNAQAGLTPKNIEAAKRVLRRGWPVAAGGEHCVLLTGFVDDESQPGGGSFQTRNYANRKTEWLSYDAALDRFESLLWIDLLPQAQTDEAR